MRESARRAGISEGWWRQIVKGSQSLSGGGHGNVRGPADTVARMAQVVGVTPDQLAEVGREDAAKILAEGSALPPAPARIALRAPDMDEASQAIYDEKLTAIRGRIQVAEASEAKLARIESRPAFPVTGIDVFPDSPVDARHWDDHVRQGVPPDEVAMVLAFSHMILQRQAEQGRGHAAGLRLIRSHGP